MGTFSRLTDIINANLNALMDKAEDPKKLLRLLVQEMEETLVELRGQAARCIAEKKQLQRKISQAQTAAKDWEAKAEQALDHERDDLAKKALQEKVAAEQSVQPLQDELARLDGLLTQMDGDISKLADKISEARSRQQEVERRHDTAQVRLTAKRQYQRQAVEQALQKFDRYEQKVEALEADVESMDLGNSSRASSLRAEFDQLQAESSVEQALQALKERRASA
ncbi:phage shock protein PspA [Idiomarina tyrosinivorans]|uniref:Phage shock protein PspA n=1 Tax=Idiomarina tyrosinivorans TaxID=1445662 RepID=A0A432ZRW9_9GAMM|nr:phage shock protein PspA [Idiomarina tyrosinivorans]RUO80647.1 phage shock protein PspA [Idiomarina tyrosinivorans]